MGHKGSSFKRKSSKKKSNKISSQVLKKKSRRKESKKRSHPSNSVSSKSKCTSSSTSESDYRSRKNKSKKLRSRDYSVSSYSEDSMSPVSDSSSSHDNSYKIRKAQHRSPIALKSRKKRAQKRLDNPNNKAESRKRKRSSRDLEVKSRKKSLKKKSRKHLTSSSSSDSESCSTYHGRSSSSTADGEHQRSKVILNKETERSSRWESHKTHRKRKRSRSSSSNSRDSDHGISVGHRDSTLAPLNKSRRLRSVIAIADQPHDERENRWEKDPYKEEIVYDHDDYPSPKSLDSNEGRCKESDSQSHGASNKRICGETVECEEVTEPVNDRYNACDPHSDEVQTNACDPHSDDRYNACDPRSDEFQTNNFDNEKETNVSVTVAALDGDGNRDDGLDLESILRQKALANLRRFHGGHQAGRRTTSNLSINNENIKESSTRRADIIQNQSTKQISNSAQEMEQRSKPILKRDFSQLTEVRNYPDGEHNEKESGIAIQTVTHSPKKAAVLAYIEKEKFSPAPAVFVKTAEITDSNPGAGSTIACTSTTEPISCVQPVSGEHSVKEQQNEAKDGSEFEQKTMSVMRGGEMVQVSYKVYIPKRAPALARRQLRR